MTTHCAPDHSSSGGFNRVEMSSVPDIDQIIAAVDRILRKRRHESRKQFLQVVALNGLMWPLIAGVVLLASNAYASNHAQSLLVNSGTRPMSANRLVANIASQPKPIFWLNRLSGDTFSHNSTITGVDVITYIPEGSTLQGTNQSDLAITTYQNSNIFNVQLRPLSATADTTVENVGGVSVTYNPASPDHSVVTFKDRPQVVTVRYSGFRSPSTLVMDAQNLERVR